MDPIDSYEKNDEEDDEYHFDEDDEYDDEVTITSRFQFKYRRISANAFWTKYFQIY